MNMLFLDTDDIGKPIPRSDARIRHLLGILKKKPGDEVLAGTPDGWLGSARIESFDGATMLVSFRPEREAPPLKPLYVILGFPRPIQARRILRDLASLGVAHIILAGTELGEKSYFQSDFFKNRDFHAALVEGATQAANPRLPQVDTDWTLARALDRLDALHELDELAVIPDEDGTAELLELDENDQEVSIPAPSPEGEAWSAGTRWAFDPYRATTGFGAADIAPAREGSPLVLAVGSERGWTTNEIDLLASRGFAFASLGDRILKTETAVVSAVAVALAKLGCM